MNSITVAALVAAGLWLVSEGRNDERQVMNAVRWIFAGIGIAASTAFVVIVWAWLLA
jgi:hypothetical protein